MAAHSASKVADVLHAAVEGRRELAGLRQQLSDRNVGVAAGVCRVAHEREVEGSAAESAAQSQSIVNVEAEQVVEVCAGAREGRGRCGKDQREMRW